MKRLLIAGMSEGSQEIAAALVGVGWNVIDGADADADADADAALVRLRARDTWSDSLIAAVADARRAACRRIPAIVILIGSEVEPLARSALRALVESFAIEFAPEVRLCAVVAGAGAAIDDVAAAVVYLAGAESTTGQLLAVTAQ